MLFLLCFFHLLFFLWFRNLGYNIDQFRKFVFESSFLRKFVIEADELEKLKTDDIALLRFGYRWLRYALFGEGTMTIRDEVAEDKKKELKMRGKLKD